MITIALCSIAFRDDPIEELIPRIAQSGYDAVEIFGKQLEGKSDDELKQVRTVADQHNLGIVSVAPYLSFTQDQAAFDESIERGRRFVHYANVLGAEKFRTFTDVGPSGVGGTVATREQWAQGIKGLKELTAMDRDIRFVLETHAKTLADSLSNIERVLDEADEPNLEVLYQPSSNFFHDYGLVESYHRLKPSIAHMHLHNNNKETGEHWIEQGELDMAGFLQAIRDDGYDESVAIEYCGKGATWERVDSACEFVTRHLRGAPAKSGLAE